ncbi:alpha/beta fold hydrolase [Nocardia sp. BSTN01]|uniref:esterase/lipase family protein n=1 Tax=Nocardia sp. BSTN01 TaxID=2783665 RepID=UPI0018907565|nr:alpha/beta fold hydrolase [Nocardia sp. BSTN01]MBF4997324.1 alpha/beta fold hydrolase [Nocardia sp. BSTN01]
MRFSWFLAFAAALMMAGHTISVNAQPPAPAMNDGNCRPSVAHPRPVVLLHGITDSTHEWDALAPRLIESGYCVFALDYGKDERTLFRINGFAPLRRSVAEVDAFIEAVRNRTGAARVDLVAHSEGAAIALFSAKEVERADRIHTEVLLAPPTFGTTLSGVVEVAERSGVRGMTDTVMSDAVCPACADLEAGSSFSTELGRAPIAAQGVRYHVLATRDDTVVTPPGTASFILETGVENVFVQDLVPGHVVDHATLPRDPVVMGWITAALDG